MGIGSEVPATALWPSPEAIASVCNGPGAATALKTTETDPTLIVSVLGPFTVPKVQLAIPAVPVASLVNVGELIEPLPVKATVITAADTGLSNASVTSALGNGSTGWATVPESSVGDFATIFATGPGSDVTVTVTGGTFAAVIVNEFVLIVLPRVHWPTEVGPFADTVGALVNVPPPSNTPTVTGTPPITFPFWSLTTNVGLVKSATPAAAFVGAAVTNSTDVGIDSGPEASWHASRVKTHVKEINE